MALKNHAHNPAEPKWALCGQFGYTPMVDDVAGVTCRKCLHLLEPEWDGERCHDCNKRYDRTIWHAPDDLWLRIMGGEGGLLCPPCFDDRCKSLGLFLIWRPEVQEGVAHRFAIEQEAAG